MSKVKVYCKNCGHFCSYSFSEFDNACTNKNNMVLKRINTWRFYEEREFSDRHPSDINKNNDCIWFEEKGAK